MFLVLSLVRWEDLEAIGRFGKSPVGVLGHFEGKVGFSPIFATRKDAETYANGKKILEIAEVGEVR